MPSPSDVKVPGGTELSGEIDRNVKHNADGSVRVTMRLTGAPSDLQKAAPGSIVLILSYDLKCEERTVALRAASFSVAGRQVESPPIDPALAFSPIPPDSQAFFERLRPITCP
jgi:hypothetical protein